MAALGGRAPFAFHDETSRQPAPANYNYAIAPSPGGHPSFSQPPGDAHGRRVASRSEHDGIMDRNSTRVHAAPGGRSSISLTDGSGSMPFGDRSGAPPPPHYNQPAPAHKPYAQQYHHVPPQYCSHPQDLQPHPNGQQPQMSLHAQHYNPTWALNAPPAVPTAPLYCNEGGVHQGRSSTRVAAPPGGHSSFSFGHNPPAAPTAQVLPRPAPHHRHQPFGNAADSLSEHVAQVRSRSNSRNTQELVQPRDRYSQPRLPDGSAANQAPAHAAEMLYCGEGGVIRGRASTRVAAPPGGHSSFSLGWGTAPSSAPRNMLHAPGRAPLVLG